MTSYITGAASLVDPGLDVLFVYKMRCPSRNRYLAEMPSHTHLKPTIRHAALTLTYRSLRSSRRSIHNGCQKKLVRLSLCTSAKKPTGKQSEETLSKEKGSKHG